MHIAVKNIQEAECRCDALILPFPEDAKVYYRKMKPSVSNLLQKVREKEFQGSQNEVLVMPAPDDVKADRLLLVGLGKKDSITPERVRQAGGKALACVRDRGMKSAALSTDVLSRTKTSCTHFIEGALLGLYTFDKYRTSENGKAVDSITILAVPSQDLNRNLARAQAIATSVCFARDLVNTPANNMTPSDLAKAAVSLKGKNLSVRVLEKPEIVKLGMGAYLAVARGSEEPPKFIILEYKGGKGAPVALVGKSITFDSGGLSLKPSDGMEKMKYDMAGGAAVLGVMKAASALSLPVHLVGLLPATENLPGGSASRPGDVVRTIDGRTVEIANTDAEGRLALADAIGYAGRYKPRAVIDVATLTGACTMAFGNEAIAMMGNDTDLMEQVERAGDETYERVWEMPLFEEYKDYLKSDIADIKNIGGRIGSLVTSGYFLYEFAGQVPWVHLDIAGTAWLDKDRPYIPRGASGSGVRLILNTIERLS
jgi:leucyl aminopeptidase